MLLTRRRRKKHAFKNIFILLSIVLLGYLVFRNWKTILSIYIISPSSTQPHHTSFFPSTPTQTPTPFLQQNSQGLANAVQNALQGTSGTYGIVIKNLKTGESYEFNGTTSFESGSLYKLWVMAVVYEQISAGFLNQNETLSRDIDYLNNEFDIPPNDTEEDEAQGEITYTVSHALYQMITISDNDAALLLTDKVGIPSLVSFLASHGFSHSKIGINGKEPLATPEDIALFFDELYNTKLANPTYTTAMISLLKQQKLNEKIPLYLPTNVAVAHKTGELGDYTHDAGIVYSPSGNYIIVVLSQSNDPPSAEGRIAQVSQDVYNYFNPPSQ